jgi:hypothetical protein
VTTDLEAAAATHAVCGVPVFPVRPGGKLPLFRSAHADDDPLRGVCRGECAADGHGVHDATTDPERIREWWAACPDANVGIACGPAGLLVLDVDPRHGGGEAILELQRRYAPLPETLWSRTGGGGWQAFFRAVGFGNSASRLGPGIDTRGQGGYVVVPPSLHPSGEPYAWWNPEIPIAPLPGWIRRLLEPRRESSNGAGKLRTPDIHSRYVVAAVESEAAAVAAASPGSRNVTLNSAAFALSAAHRRALARV